MFSPSDMTGKTALITGAAAGLGKATALLLAQTGANLSLIDINSEGLEEIASAARATGVDVIVQTLDLSNTNSCQMNMWIFWKNLFRT